MGRDHHLVKYKQNSPSRISGGDFFVNIGSGRKGKNMKFEISNGHNWGAILSNRDETLTIEKAIARSIFLEGSHGAWGLGLWEQIEKKSVSLFWTFRLTFKSCVFWFVLNTSKK